VKEKETLNYINESENVQTVSRAAQKAGDSGYPGAGKKLYGYLVEFDNTPAVLKAAGKVREAGYTKWDVHTPFPIHGIDNVIGIQRTVIPKLVLGAGILGFLTAFALQLGTNAFDYPWIVSGKPLYSIPANIPIVFELIVLFSALTAVFSLILINGLPQLYHPLFTNRRFCRVTNDRFFIVIEAEDPKFHATKTPEFLQSLGGTVVEKVED
jgi:hypothetical protein